MNNQAALFGLLIIGLTSADPIYENVLTLTDAIYNDGLVTYTGENDITKIVVPLKAININENFDGDAFYLFFIEEGKGLFVLKDGVATKLLDNGKDITSSFDESTTVYLAATDGIYTYNSETKTAEKYGTLTDDIKYILVTNTSEEMYILTEDNVYYKVLEDGTKREEVTNVKDAVQVVFDRANHLYFVDSQNRLYVRNFETGDVKRVKGLPPNPSTVKLLRPPALFAEDGTIFVSGKRVYGVNPNGTSEFAEVIADHKPTASAIEASLILYFAHDKKIYKFNIMDIVQSAEASMAPVKTYINRKATGIQEIAKRKSFRRH